jgi:hypothetical protein
MKTNTVRSSWFNAFGYRLDCQPYLAGSLEARVVLEGLSRKREPLHSLTTGYAGGIYNGPQFRRVYVESRRFGVPFLGSSAMLRTDLSSLPLLSKREAFSKQLSHLELGPGITLISCSGTVGNTIYSRADMKGMWSSQDTLKVVADREKIQPGYLYAFLSSKYGIPLVVSGTYGAIIQHIEPEHIARLPVPRLPSDIEEKIGDLVEDAYANLSKCAMLRITATQRLLSGAGIEEVSPEVWNSDRSHLGWGETPISPLTLRSLNYDPRATRLEGQIRTGKHVVLGDVCDEEAFKGQIIFKRVEAAPEYGVRLLGQREAFQVRPQGRWISRASVEGLGLQVPSGTTLIASHGTLGEFELYSRALYVTERTSEYAYSGDFYRCIPVRDKIPAGYLYAFLRSEVAFRLLRSMSSGGKQQLHHSSLIYNMPIPRVRPEVEREIAAAVDEASACFDTFLGQEEEAWALLERELLN